MTRECLSVRVVNAKRKRLEEIITNKEVTWQQFGVHGIMGHLATFVKAPLMLMTDCSNIWFQLDDFFLQIED